MANGAVLRPGETVCFASDTIRSRRRSCPTRGGSGCPPQARDDDRRRLRRRGHGQRRGDPSRDRDRIRDALSLDNGVARGTAANRRRIGPPRSCFPLTPTPTGLSFSHGPAPRLCCCVEPDDERFGPASLAPPRRKGRCLSTCPRRPANISADAAYTGGHVRVL